MKLSVVIPAFEERRKIGGDIAAGWEFLRRNGIDGEIIIVDDGSRDGTAEAARQAGQEAEVGSSVRVISGGEHRGKGYAVRMGIQASRGEFVMFADSGCCVPYEDVLRGLKMVASGQCEIAHGSRKMNGTQIIRGQGFYRRMCSAAFHWVVVRIMGVPAELTDSQCGFKVYRGQAARHLYGECRTDGFMFDVEVILRALKEGYRIKEFPIEWSCDRDSRLSPARSALKVAAELWNIKRSLSAGG